MKSVIAFSVMAILFLLSVTVLGHNASSQIAYAQTSSGAATLPDFNFAAAGDWGCKGETTETVNNILDKNPELVLGLGDFSYGDDAGCWLEIVEPIDDIMKIAFGNEDLQASEETELMEHFGLSNQYYSFDYQNVHFTVMDDYLPDEIGSEQYIFVQNDLAKAAADPNINWIVLVHHSQKYASTKNYDIPEEREWNNIYHPLFEQYNVDLVVQGHQHNYQRTYPIKYDSGTPMNPIITDKNKSNYTNPEGQIFATVGTGGVNHHKLNGNKAPYTVIAQDEEFGFLNVDIINSNNINNDGTTALVGTFYANDGGDKIIDQFTITKSASGDSSPLPSPPLPPPQLSVPETDEVEEGDDEDVDDGLDDAVVSEDDEDVDAVAADDEQEEEEEEEESDEGGGGE
jgi:hypothetical protein